MDNYTNQEPELNTNTQQPPKLDFLRRFIVDTWNNRVTEVERQTTGPLMTPLWSFRWFAPRALSNVAKVDANGVPAQSFNNKLPDIAVSAVLIQQAQYRDVKGAGSAKNFPFKLKAVGPVNAWMIYEHAGQPGQIVSSDVRIVP